MRRSFSMAAGAAALMLAGRAHAATFLLDYDAFAGAPFSADLTVTASDVLNAAGAYDVTAITGAVDGDAVTALIDNPNKPWASYSADGWFIIDNNIWPTAQPIVSNPGLFFRGASGDEYNLFSDNAETYELYKARAGVGYVDHSWGALAISPGRDGLQAVGTPEPAAWAMMIAGFAGAGAILRHRRAQRLADAA